MQELCDSLCRVLDHCAQLDRRRLAGYVANIDFWLDEIQHRLKLIEGYVSRRRSMVAGTDQVYAADIRRSLLNSPGDLERLITPNATDTSADWEALQNESAKLRDQVLASTKRLLKRCVATELIVQDKLFEIEDQLGVSLRSSNLCCAAWQER
jgi:hypothetical protein